MDKIHIMLVDDHPIYRMGIKLTLTDIDHSIDIVCEAETVSESLEVLDAQHENLDLVLLDVLLPDGNGLTVAEYMQQHYPNLKVLVLSAELREANLLPFLNLGIGGFLNKDIDAQELSNAIHSVMEGSRYYGKSLNTIIDNLMVARQLPKSHLSEREKEILKLCASGLTASQIADKLFISKRTVESHKEHIFNKLGFNSTSELINYAFHSGLVG